MDGTDGSEASTPGTRARRRWPWAFVPALLIVLVGAAWVVARDDSLPRDITTRADDPPSASDDPAAPSTDTAVESPERCDVPEVYVFMRPTATAEQTDAVRTHLESIDTLSDPDFVDRDATYERFIELFGDQPDFVASIDPDDLPESFRVHGDLDPTTEQAIEAIDGVLRVESALEYRQTLALQGRSC